MDGLRTSKTVNGVKHEYYYVGNTLQYEKFGTTELWFFYDADGNPSGVRYKNGSTTIDYYFVCNWRGDVIRIYDGAGAVVANYNYDAWGSVISVTDANGAAITDSTHIANVNPLRYRGYYYDSETGLYYLQSRYYDPAVKRFINADTLLGANKDILGNNVFAYCSNNPANHSDPTGHGILKDAWNWVKEKVKPWIDPVKDFSSLIVGTTEQIVKNVKVKKKIFTNSNGYVKLYPKGCEPLVNRFPNATKGLSFAGKTFTVISVVSTSAEVIDTWIAPNANTNMQRAIKTGSIIGGAALNIGVGALAVALANCWNPAGWGLVGAGVTFVAISAVGSIAITLIQDTVYNAYDIE